jgi:hypothetical protein
MTQTSPPAPTPPLPSAAPARPPSPEAAALSARGDRLAAALEPVARMDPPPPPAAKGAATGLTREVRRMSARLSGGRVEVGLFGLPKAGKSTLLNALAGRVVSATDVLPETAFPIYLVPVPPDTPPASLRCRVHFRADLKRPPMELPPDELGRISRERSVWDPREVEFAEVPSATEVLGPGFCFIDTPGLEEFVAEYGDRSDRLLNDETDAAILVATPDQAMRDTVRRFISLAARRCPRLWIALNVDIHAQTLMPDGSRREVGTAEFARLRERFGKHLSDIPGAGLMLKEGTASVHIFTAQDALKRRLDGAGIDALSADEATRELAELAAQVRGWAGDPAREAHAVRFWSGRLAEIAVDAASSVESAAGTEKEKADRLAAELEGLEAKAAERDRLDASLREVLTGEAREAAEPLKAEAADAVAGFVETPLRQAVAGWMRGGGSLSELHSAVRTSFAPEAESMRRRLRGTAAKRAEKLAALVPPGEPGQASLPANEPADWASPAFPESPPAELVGDLDRLPVWLGRIAGLAFLVASGVIGWLVVFVLSWVPFVPSASGPVFMIVLGGTLASWLGVKWWARRELLDRRWSGWLKMLLLPTDAERVRGIYGKAVREIADAEAAAAAAWVRGRAERMLSARRGGADAELSAARTAATVAKARVETLLSAAAEVRRLVSA